MVTSFSIGEKMIRAIRTGDARHNGSVLVLSLIFIVMFSALAVGMASLSGTNVQVAQNHHKANLALVSAESGMEIMQYWLMRVRIPSTTVPGSILSTVSLNLAADLSASNISNVTASYNGSAIAVPSVSIDSQSGQTFDAVVRQIDDYTLQMDVTGRHGQITRTIRVNFPLVATPNPIFDYGLATRGPLRLPGNPTSEGLNALGEADIYIESSNDLLALDVSGNTNFDGDITVGNPSGSVYFDGDVQIAGDHGQAAIDNHVSIGGGAVEFPVPDTDHLRQYATGSTITASTDTSDNMTLTNRLVVAGANPCFDGNIQIEGILFVEAPNTIMFKGNVNVKGLIVADGDVENPGDNGMTFEGNFDSGPLPNDAIFDVMRQETGASLLAPGFSYCLKGNFRSLGGVMAVSGVYIYGNVDATVAGTIINYCDEPTLIEGNPTLRFDRSGSTEVPAGFASDHTLTCDRSSYEEIRL